MYGVGVTDASEASKSSGSDPALVHMIFSNHAIRWMAEFRAAVQVSDQFFRFKDIIENQDVGCTSLMETLRAILQRPAQNGQPCGETVLRLELAIQDVGEPIAQFCNRFEGDGFLSPYAYDSWHHLNDHLKTVVERYPEVNYRSYCREVARDIAPDSLEEQQEMVEFTVAKAVVVLQKLESDTLTRFSDTLKILRGCRLLAYEFVRETTIEALEDEYNFVQYLPVAVNLIESLKLELRTYKKLADEFGDERGDGWVFWRTHYLRLPKWYKVAAEAALVMCSSASVERVFSLLNCLFDDQQHQCLNDYKEASVMIRYNENYRNRN